jgi:hypothetical protein
MKELSLADVLEEAGTAIALVHLAVFIFHLLKGFFQVDSFSEPNTSHDCAHDILCVFAL